jgi:hypothetical protein
MNSATAGRNHLHHEIMVGGLSNTVFNGVIAWLLIKNGPDLHWRGDHSFAIDVIATACLLPFIVALIVIPLQRGKLFKGELQPLQLGSHSTIQSLADHFPASTFKSALLFGLIGLLVIAPLTLMGLYFVGVDSFTPPEYALFKGLWAGLMAAVLVIPMVLIALRQPTVAL